MNLLINLRTREGGEPILRGWFRAQMGTVGMKWEWFFC
jgi:hypothetical protein